MVPKSRSPTLAVLWGPQTAPFLTPGAGSHVFTVQCLPRGSVRSAQSDFLRPASPRGSSPSGRGRGTPFFILPHRIEPNYLDFRTLSATAWIPCFIRLLRDGGSQWRMPGFLSQAGANCGISLVARVLCYTRLASDH